MKIKYNKYENDDENKIWYVKSQKYCAKINC